MIKLGCADATLQHEAAFICNSFLNVQTKVRTYDSPPGSLVPTKKNHCTPPYDVKTRSLLPYKPRTSLP
ncbi:hypothetical protein CICLE_v10006386mg [Citrus x clementina]|uniref:Uncharacterized protein n=1 Tax=Citrus clementina TaxID=85681 RepID=V4RGH9_CITCL|nr:hypothetical protein CICLE_v10006386mg [Citrus x clementina]